MEKFQYSAAEMSFIENSRMPFGIFQFIDMRIVTVALSRGFCDLFGFADLAELYDIMDKDMYRQVCIDDIAHVSDSVLRFLADGDKYDILFHVIRNTDNKKLTIHAAGEKITAPDGTQLYQIWYTDETKYTNDDSDVSFMAEQDEKDFIKASRYDHLTGLPGMTYFFKLSTAKRTGLEDEGEEPAMLFTDFSGMKYYNQKNGFSAGDKLLQSFSRLLVQHFGIDNCSRFGQDHFAVITRKRGLEQELERLIEECRDINDGVSLPLHIGIYDQWYDNILASVACDRAKIACDSLSATYSSAFSYYNMSMKDAEEKQQYIIANIDKAIEEGWIKVYFQPIVRAVSGRVCDEEALARWIDPVKGFMSPADFIPILEEHKLIYKLDLYVVESVLLKTKMFQKEGLHIMPQSINLSRSDFDTCDIVEEIRKRVDASGIDRSMITIEITESMIGQDFEFMVAQINRLRDYGFAVWMDDFGSGYSSLDVLQSVNFDLIKFDMRFMQQLGNGQKGKVILTELINMASSLGIDTICEGVETKEQVQFLQEAGCSKLQGYYFDKPNPVERILEKYATGVQIGFENPAESQYYESIGRTNLHDLSIIAQDDMNKFDNFFNTLPMAIIEVKGNEMRFARSNQSYREFIYRYYDYQLTDQSNTIDEEPETSASPFIKALQQCGENGGIMYIDENFGDSVVHSCIRRIAVNPTTNKAAVAVAVLSITDNSKGTTYANIAMALAANYVSLYYIDLTTGSFIEYSSDADVKELSVERHGKDFFTESRIDALSYVYKDDQECFLAAFTKENILGALKEQGTFTLTYRLVMGSDPVYVNLKAMRMQQESNHLIIGVESIDSQMKQKMALERIRRNELIYSRIMALSGDYICMYVVDPDTNEYYEYSANDDFKDLGLARNGSDFFAAAHKYCVDTIVPEDQQYFKDMLTKERMIKDIDQNGLFTMQYRFIISGKPTDVIARGALVSESDGPKLILGVQYAH